MNAVKIVLIICVFISSACKNVHAEDIETVIDGFYDGLALVIESNANDPDRCLREVNAYYEKNQKVVEKIRDLTAKGMEQAMAVQDKSSVVAVEEPQAFDLMAFQRGITAPDLTPGSVKYTNALREFTKKFPREGLRIAGKTVDLLPDVKTLR